MLKEVVGNKTDILLVSKTKLGDTFPRNQFILEGFTPPYRLDRTTHGGGLMLFCHRGYTFQTVNLIWILQAT